MTIPRLDRTRYMAALVELSGRDRDLGRILEELGPPPMWNRDPGFPTLIHIILEQQVSLASARACFDKLAERVGTLTPESLLDLGDAELKADGFSRQKTEYARVLARAIADGSLDLDGLAEAGDQEARDRLMAVKGIGRWTADIYLLMALRRPDIWPVGDLALVIAAKDVKGLDHRPSAEEFQNLGEAWKPWRSVAARLLWHQYLADRGRGAGSSQ